MTNLYPVHSCFGLGEIMSNAVPLVPSAKQRFMKAESVPYPCTSDQGSP